MKRHLQSYIIGLAIVAFAMAGCGNFEGSYYSSNQSVSEVGSQGDNNSPKNPDHIESSVDSNVKWQRASAPSSLANGDDIAAEYCVISQETKLICASKRDNRVIIVKDCSDKNCRIAAYAHSSSRRVLAILVEYPQADARSISYELFLGATPFASADFRLLRAFPSGMPTPHALLFVEERLYVYGERYLAFFDANEEDSYTVWSELSASFPSLERAIVVKAQIMGTVMDTIWANNRTTGKMMQNESTFVEWVDFDSSDDMPMNVQLISSNEQAVSMLARDNTDQYRIHWRCSPLEPIVNQPLTSSNAPIDMFWMPTKSGRKRLIMRFANYIGVWLPNGKLHKIYNPLFDSSNILSAIPISEDRLYVQTANRNYVITFAADYGLTCLY
jgi:hypothetical protein